MGISTSEDLSEFPQAFSMSQLEINTNRNTQTAKELGQKEGKRRTGKDLIKKTEKMKGRIFLLCCSVSYAIKLGTSPLSTSNWFTGDP